MSKETKKIVYPLIIALIIVAFTSCDTVGKGTTASIGTVISWRLC